MSDNMDRADQPPGTPPPLEEQVVTPPDTAVSELKDNELDGVVGGGNFTFGPPPPPGNTG